MPRRAPLPCGMQGSTNSNERCYGFLHTLNLAVSLQILLTKPVKAQGLLIPKSGSRPQHPRMYLANGNGTWEIHRIYIWLVVWNMFYFSIYWVDVVTGADDKILCQIVVCLWGKAHMGSAYDFNLLMYFLALRIGTPCLTVISLWVYPLYFQR